MSYLLNINIRRIYYKILYTQLKYLLLYKLKSTLKKWSFITS